MPPVHNQMMECLKTKANSSHNKSIKKHIVQRASKGAREQRVSKEVVFNGLHIKIS